MLWHPIAIVLILVVNTSCENDGIVVLYEVFVTCVCYFAMLSIETMVENSLVPRPSHEKRREGLGDGPIRACSGGICAT